MATRKNTPQSGVSADVTAEAEPTTADPIEWARLFWREHDLDGDEQRFLTLTALLRYHRIVTESVSKALQESGLNLTDYLLLMTLELSERGTRLISSLARNLLIHPTTATLATDRLEGRGLLNRNPHPVDRRAILVTISDEGRDLARRATIALDSVGFGFIGASDKSVAQMSKTLHALRDAASDYSED